MEIKDLATLDETYYDIVGGKAKGLAVLAKNGLSVPRGFVVIGANSGETAAVLDYYETNHYGNVAVRSSASNEDGTVFSGAGQYESFLNINTEEELSAAYLKCLESLKSERALSYQTKFSGAKNNVMNIVVQDMIDSKYAGVCFTVNPANKEHSFVIEAVAGLGEALVAGLVKSSSYEVNLNINKIIGTGILDYKTVTKIALEAQKARNIFDVELDLEWAITQDDELIFLQARPITTLDDATVSELDCSFYNSDCDVFTTCNIGEMLPGAVTPLSLSTSVAAIDRGLRQMLVSAGAFKNMQETIPGSCVTSFSNHLFFNLTTVYKMASTIIGANKESVEVSICGKQLATPISPWPLEKKLKRIFNMAKYFSFLLSKNAAIRQVDKLLFNMNIPFDEDPHQYYQNIDDNIGNLNQATLLHYKTSAHSGAMSSALLFILNDFYPSIEETRGVIAELLENIEDIESVDILRSMRKLGRSIIAKNPESVNFTNEELLNYIEKDNGGIKENYHSFLKRHGHRAIMEAEMRNKSWQNDLDSLMDNILTVMKTGATEEKKAAFNLNDKLQKITAGKKFALKKGIIFLTKQSRKGVYNREYTKARFVRACDKFKEAYAKLADILVENTILPEADLIYFLKHEEIGRLINDNETSLVKKAFQRRNIFEEQKEIRYNDVYIGKPLPIVPTDIIIDKGTILKGVPISRGEVRGPARVVKTIEDARKLQSGEIMVAAFTDIGWSPYYSVIKGLVTEVGSALSHGAVVAREYALPLVVNVNNATLFIKTGDLIKINGTTGQVTILNE